jgi:hypothetical protein
MPNEKRSAAKVTLLIADTSAPLGFAASSEKMPVLASLQSRSSKVVSRGQALEDAVLAAFDCDSRASIATLTQDVEEDPADIGAAETWLRADPVHFAVSRDNVQLFDSHVVLPTAAEMEAIAATLNKHFVQDGISVHFPDRARGYVRVPTLPTYEAPRATPLWAMPGANVFDNLPQQQHADAKINWRAITNEVQMLLHDHPVNIEREQRAKPAINGLWFWGAGDANVKPAKKFDCVVARLILARGLTQASNAKLISLPKNDDARNANIHAGFQGIASAISGETLIVLHQATREIRAQSADSWRDAVTMIDRDWIAPAIAAFDRNEIETLTIVVANESETHRIAVKKKNWLQRLFK